MRRVSILKKKKRLTLVCLLALILLLLCGCTAKDAEDIEEELVSNAAAQDEMQEVNVTETVITESRHRREEGYAADFKTYRLELDVCTVDMESRLYDETALRAAGEQITQALAAMEEKTGTPARNVEVYLVQQMLNGRAQAVGSHVFCAPEDLNDRSYRPALTQASYGLTRPWQAVGLSRYIFEAAPDATELQKFYEDAAHENLLSLFPLYFLPDFVDLDTAQMAEQTAQSVTAYVLEKDGLDAFCELDATMDAVAPWALANQIEAPSLPEGCEAVDALAVAAVSDHSVILQADRTMDRFRFVLEPKDWIATADDFYTYLCRFYAGYHMMLEQMEQALPTAFAQVSQNVEQQITVKFIDIDKTSVGGENQVSIGSDGAIWHEILHNMLPLQHGAKDADHWMGEGLAEYFSLPVETQFGGHMQEIMYQYLTAVWNEQMTAEEKEHFDCILRCYTARFAVPEQANEIDYAWLYRSFAITTLLRGDLQLGDYALLMNTRSLQARAGLGAGEKDADGNGLTYPEALLMVDYLAERYGIDHVVSSYLAHQSCEEAYGKAYAALYQDFYAWVQESYGDLIENVSS